MNKRLHIGVVTKYVEGAYHGSLINGINNCVKANNTKLLVVNTHMISRFFTDEKKVENYYSLALNHVDGWIILSESAGDSHLNTLIKTKKPIVFVGLTKTPNDCTSIKNDNITGAMQAVEHLIMHGHRKIGFIGWMGIDDMKERLTGYRNVLSNNGIDYDENLVFRSEYVLPIDGKAAIEHWMKNGIDFTAIFAGNDAIAVGAIRELNNYGLSVPEDVAVVGYDNSPFAIRNNPGITTIEQNIYDLGYSAAQNLLDEINNTALKGRTVLVNSNLVKRKSCGCDYCSYEKAVDIKEALSKEDRIIKYLEGAILKNSSLGESLLSADINGIKKLFTYMVDNYCWECIGYLQDEKSDNAKLKISSLFDISKNEVGIDLTYDFENFPPLELIPEAIAESDNIIWILPISSTTKNWGVLAYASPYDDVTAMSKYSASIIVTTLLGIAMDRDVAKNELEAALDTLKQTHDQLIQSDKMAAMGGLVAGVAHEVNTPIGVSVTAASYLDEKNKEILRLLETGKLKKTDLEKYINTTLETVGILMINLERASNLVKSFKQIAADQSEKEKRTFYIKDYINDVLLGLKPKLKKTRHTLLFNCEDNIEIHTSPGGLSQIITNLVVNSLVHAFEETNNGIISINVHTGNDELVIEFGDNGKGINENDIKKIYEPFFTTKRGQGGSGLGLNIVYNIVTNEYKGSIKCKSRIGKGTTFIIRIPIKEVTKSNGKQ
ncbi:MAG: substrate-binding domain-containing protein [Clostridiaceae bacterium]|nr:substrate-binding domain-containing protein [Clostridiaceae bacterium]